MIVMTLFCAAAGAYLGRQRAIVSERKSWPLRQVGDYAIYASSPENNDLPWARRLLGDFKVDEIVVRPSLLIDGEFAMRLRKAFPEATIHPWKPQWGNKID